MRNSATPFRYSLFHANKYFWALKDVKIFNKLFLVTNRIKLGNAISITYELFDMSVWCPVVKEVTQAISVRLIL